MAAPQGRIDVSPFDEIGVHGRGYAEGESADPHTDKECIMRGVPRRCAAGSLLAAGVVLLVCAFSPSPAAAAHLAVRLVGGQGHAYELGDIQDLVFAGDTLQVVTTGATDVYELARIVRIDFDLDAWTGVDDTDLPDDVVRALHLFQNQPNPFSPETRIAYELPQGGRAQVRIYSVNGRLVRTLLDAERPAGRHSIAWDALDDSGRSVSSGVYFYTLTAPGVEESRKMLLLR
ncbi:MAG: T9SS type A sorting domain-containing protein [Candidatus Eisenbacteria bacterium]|nr:T9SS type A sorting domain-containing protein [Candidatus Eisenbacteria bacterium]